MLAIFKRELRSCFHGMIGAVLTAFMLAATAIYFVALNLGYGLPDFGYYTLYRTIFVLLLYIPVLTMRSFAEERHSRTDRLVRGTPPAAPTSCCLQARCRWAASCWANILPFASFLRCPALWMRA